LTGRARNLKNVRDMATVRKKRPRPPRTEDAMPLGRRERNKLEKRNRIRDAAWASFTTKGFEATTTKDVADRAGVAAGTLFLYARDKRDLLFLVMYDRLDATVNAAFLSLSRAAPLLDQLLHVFRAIFRMYGEHPGVANDFVRALPSGGDTPNGQAVTALTFGFLARLAQLVQAAQERGEIDRAVVPMDAAHNVFALYFAALHGWLSGFVSIDAALDVTLTTSLRLQFQGLYPRAVGRGERGKR
jgi:AcrR family transcriptional regulator